MDNNIINNKNINIGKLVLMLCMILVVVVGGTFAWLTYSTKEAALVLTIGDINDTQIKLSPYEITGTITPSTGYEDGVYSEVEISKGNNNATSFALFYKINDLDVELIDNGLSYEIVDTKTNQSVKRGTFKELLGAGWDTSKPLPEEIIILDTNTDANLSANTAVHYRVYLWVNSNAGEQSAIQDSTLDVELNASIGSVQIAGTTTYGETLTSTINDAIVDDDTTYSYQWYYNNSASATGGTAISGATSSSYVIGKEAVGNYVYVVVTTSKGKTLSNVFDTQVAKKQINVSSLAYGTITKTYDGNTSVPSGFAVSTTASSGLINSDTVTVNYTDAVYNSANVTEAEKITVTGLSLSGTNASYYALSSTSYDKTGATISVKTLNIGTHSATYNATTTYTRTFSTGVGSENLVLTYKPYSKNVISGGYAYATSAGNSKYTVTKADGSGKASNYNITSGSSFTINQKTLTVASFTYSPLTKIYDGNTNAPSGFKVTATTTSGLISGDTVTVNHTGAIYNNATVAGASTITVSGLSLSGTDAGNYKLNATSYAKTGATITNLTATVTASSTSKTYDGSALTTNACTATGLVSGHTVTCVMTSASTITDAGSQTNTINTVTIKSGSTDVTANYTVTKKTGTLTVNKKSLSLGAYSVTYNATTSYSRTFSTGVGSENLTLTYKPYSKVVGNYTYATSAGSSKYTVTSANGTGKVSNYSIGSGGTFTINQKELSPSVTASNKTYDGGVTATCTVSLSGVISGDTVSASSTGAFDNKNVGTGKTVTCSSITLSGTDMGNYKLNATSKTTTANITAKALTITAKAQTVTYGTAITTGVGQVTSSGLISGDSLTSITLTPSRTTAGSGTITPSAAVIKDNSGSGSTVTSNYSITYKTGTLSINTKKLTTAVSASNKTYDGTTNASCTVSLTGVVSGDTVTASATGTFNNKNIGTGKTVTCSSISLSGSSAGNYSLDSTSKTTTANITARSITITAKAQTVTYGTAITTGVGQVTVGGSGLASGDALSSITLTPSTTNYVTNGTITPSAAVIKDNSGSGTAMTSNYSITYNTGKLVINKKTVTASVTSSSKTYDGTTSATCSVSLTGVLSGDTVTASATGTFNNKNVGTGKTVTCSSITLSGSSSGNYSLDSTSKTTTANITARSITITAKAQTVTYGTAITTGVGQVTVGGSGLVSGDALSSITLTPSTTNATTSGTITPSAAVIKDNNGSGTAMTSNYSITYNTGKLVINKSKTATTGSCNTLTYTGSAQTLASGAANATYSNNSGTNATSYTVNVESGSNYTFSDGTTSKTLSCSIAKATPTITLSAASGTVESGSTATFKVTTKSTPNAAGTLKVTSGTTTYVTITDGASNSITASSSGVEKTITYKGTSTEGSSTITITFTPTDTSNFNTASKTFAATNDDTIAPTVPTYVAVYNTGGNAYSEGTWTNEQVNTTISSSDTGTGVNYIQYCEWNTSNSTCGSWSIFSFGLSNGLVKDGTATWSGIEPWSVIQRNQYYKFRACDVAGNCSAAMSTPYNIRYDVTAPSISYSAFYADGSGTYTSGSYAESEVQTTITAKDDHVGTITKFQYTFNANATNSTNEGSDATTNWKTLNLVISGGLNSNSDGSYYGTEAWTFNYGRNDNVYIRACDSLNNCSEKIHFNIKYIDVLSGSVKITGTNTYNQTLTASVTNTDSANLSYQWYYNSSNSTSGGTAISGATSSTYKIESGLVGKYIYVVVTASKTGYLTASWSDITDASNNTTATVARAKTATTGSCSTLTYTGSAQTLASGAANATYSNNSGTNATTYTVTVTAGSNYAFSDGTTSKTLTCSISKATPTITVSPTSAAVNYNATGTFSATTKASPNAAGTLTASSGSTTYVTITGGASNSITATSSGVAKTITYKGVKSTTSATTITLTFTPTDTTNFNTATQTFSVTKVNAIADTVTVSTASTVTYDGSTHGTTASATSGSTVTLTYYSDSSCSTKTTTTNAASSGGAPKNAGTYYAKGTTAASTNYTAGTSSCTKAITINKATPTITVSPTSAAVNYNATGTFTATTKSSPSAAGTLTASSGSTTYVSITGGASNSITATSSGVEKTITYKGVKAYSSATTITLTFTPTDTTNFNTATQTFSVTKVNAIADTVTVSTASTVTYDAKTHGTTASATSGSTVTLTYYSDSSCSTKTTTTNAGSAGGAPCAAGTYYAKGTTAASTNYTAGTSSCTKAITINKATPTITVSPTSAAVRYNATGTFSATTKSSPNALGTLTASSGSTTYVSITGGASNSFTATSSGVAKPITYKGVKSTTSATTITLTFTPTDTTNFNTATQTFSVTKVNAIADTITVSTASTVTYDGSTHGTTASAPSGSTVTLTYYSDSSCSTKTTTANAASAGGAPKNAGTYYAIGTTKASTNYTAGTSICTKAITINKATPTITVSPTSAAVNYNATGTFSATTKSSPSAAGTLTASSGSTTYVSITGGESNSITATSSGVAKTITYKGVKSTTSATTITLTFTPTDTTNFNTATQTFSVTKVNSSPPTCTLSSTTNLKSASQTVTATITTSGTLSKYYWGTSSSGTPGTSNTSTSLPLTADSGATWYLRVSDTDGNIGSCSIVMVSYTVQNRLLTGSGTKGTYNTTNYGLASTHTYLIPDNTYISRSNSMTVPAGGNSSSYAASLYTGTSSIPSSGTATTTSSVTITSTNKVVVFWIDAIEYNVEFYLGNAKSTAGATKLNTQSFRYGESKALTTFANLGAVFPHSADANAANSSVTNYGWKFHGWGTSTSDTSRDYADGATVSNLSTTSGGTVKLYAIGYKGFQFNSGIAPTTVNAKATQYWNPYSTASSYLTSITLPAATAISSWTFLGYRAGSSSASSTVTSPFTAANVSKTVTPSYDVYATTRGVYSRTLTISYGANGGSGSTSNTTATQYYNSGYVSSGSNSGANVSTPSFTLRTSGFTKSGSTFINWCENTDGSGVCTNASAAYSSWVPAVGTTTVTKTLYAFWVANETINADRFSCDADDSMAQYYVTTCNGYNCSYTKKNYLTSSFGSWTSSSDGDIHGTPSWSLNKQTKNLYSVIKDNANMSGVDSSGNDVTCYRNLLYIDATSGLNCRYGPSTSTSVYKAYSKGTSIYVWKSTMKYNSSYRWYYSSTNDCYLAGQYISTSKPSTNAGSSGTTDSGSNCTWTYVYSGSCRCYITAALTSIIEVGCNSSRYNTSQCSSYCNNNYSGGVASSSCSRTLTCK